MTALAERAMRHVPDQGRADLLKVLEQVHRGSMLSNAEKEIRRGSQADLSAVGRKYTASLKQTLHARLPWGSLPASEQRRIDKMAEDVGAALSNDNIEWK